MIIPTVDIKSVCSSVLLAVDVSDVSAVAGALALHCENNVLTLSVTNREYFVKISVHVLDSEDFDAVVDSQLFLKLVSSFTAETVTLEVVGSFLVVKSNGEYKLPLIYDGKDMLKLPEIELNNVVTDTTCDAALFKSIMIYNSKELMKDNFVLPVQQLYFVDKDGCLTFTTGACVNKFSLPITKSLLFNSKLVKLFKLLDEEVKVQVAEDAISQTLTQTKIRLSSGNVEISSILFCDDSMINTVPTGAIRNRSDKDYPCAISVEKDMLLQSINRLMLFMNKTDVAFLGDFDLKDTVMTISINRGAKETVFYDMVAGTDGYHFKMNLNDLKLALDAFSSSDVILKFGDHQAIVVVTGNISYVVPEQV